MDSAIFRAHGQLTHVRYYRELAKLIRIPGRNRPKTQSQRDAVGKPQFINGFINGSINGGTVSDIIIGNAI